MWEVQASVRTFYNLTLQSEDYKTRPHQLETHKTIDFLFLIRKIMAKLNYISFLYS